MSPQSETLIGVPMFRALERSAIKALDARCDWRRVTAKEWVIDYQEVAPQTIIRTTLGADMPSRGRFWIEPSTGRVLATELIVVDVDIHATIVVGYDAQPPLELLVPVEMRERYNVQRPQSTVVGTATYRKFRQFQVTVDETFAPIK